MLSFAAARTAWAGLSGQIEPGYAVTQTSSSEGGRQIDATSQVLTQNYRLTLDEAILPYLLFQGGGVFDDQHDWSTTGPASSASESDVYALTGFADLTLGSPLLTGVIGYRWRQTSQSSTLVDGRSTLTNQDIHFSGFWRPVGLPTISLNLGRVYAYDNGRGLEDRVNDTAQVTARYHSIEQLDLRYAGTLGRLEDRANDFEQRNVSHTVSAVYADSFFHKRANLFIGYNLTALSTSLSSASGNGQVTRQQIATAGLSLVEAFPAVPTLDTLTANAALLDGDLDTAAGLDLGYGPQVAGDNAYRDLGAQFSDPFPEVNRIYVVVDRTLSSTIAGAFTWEAFRSDDNVNWAPVSLTVGPRAVPFDVVNRRFEVPIERTSARYLKVVTRPLEPTVTSDPRFSRIAVTEVQFFLIVGVNDAAAAPSLTSNVVNVSLGVKLLETENLSYDLSLLVSNIQADTSRTSYFLTNGLSFRKSLAPSVGVNARVSRQDSDNGLLGHLGAFIHGAGLSYDPLPTLSHRLLYSGDVRQLPVGTSYTNSLNLINRATLYDGVVLGATIGGDLGENEVGQARRGLNALVSADVMPHSMLGLNATYVYGYALLAGSPSATQNGASASEAPITQDRVTGGVSFRPLATLYLTGAVTWSRRTGAADRFLANYGLNFSPLPGGSLQLDLAYSETDETVVQGISRLFSSNVRWNIRTGTLLTFGYTFSQTRTQDRESVSNAFYSKLTVAI